MNEHKKNGNGTNYNVMLFACLVFLWPLGMYLAIKHRDYWLKKAWFVTISLALGLTAGLIIISIIKTPSNRAYQEKEARVWKQTVALEKNLDYQINLSESATNSQNENNEVVHYNCNLKEAKGGKDKDKYSDQSATFSCTNEVLSGNWTQVKSTSLHKDGFGSDLKTKGNDFNLGLVTNSFGKSDWEKDSLDFDTFQKDGIDKVLYLSIKNDVLDSATMLRKPIAIHYNFTDNDIALLKKQNNSYTSYVQTQKDKKAKEEADKKAREDAIKQAKEDKIANDQRVKQEAKNKVQRDKDKAQQEADNKKAEQEAKDRAQREKDQAQKQPAAPAPRPENDDTSTKSPNSGVTDVVSGYCNDGTYVTGNPSARGGASACYGHRGWRDY